jgi:hypothetical protein
MWRLFLASLAVLVLIAAAGATPPPPVVTNVIVITLDGMRWQELFGGAERSLLGKDEKEITGSSAYRRCWRETQEDRRAALMPYLWTVVAKRARRPRSLRCPASPGNGDTFRFDPDSRALVGKWKVSPFSLR